jgi:anti-sigma regulatory factor (Ser/Thr protein kinase)
VVTVSEGAFRHEALFYDGEDEFLSGTLPFIREGVAAGEPVLIAVGEAKIRLLERRLHGSEGGVRLVDMKRIGRNPARMIPLWREFVDDHSIGGRPVRGIGEPVWPGRTEAELIECQRSESLLNKAFADAPAWRLLCPYDSGSLSPAVLEAAQRTHPLIADRGVDRESRESETYLEPTAAPGPFDAPLAEPSTAPDELAFGGDTLTEARRLVYRQAMDAGLAPARTSSLVLAVNELATNSVRHAGGDGTIRVWREADALVCEVRDRGDLASSPLGPGRPEPLQLEGRGLWLVNQVCDLVQIRAVEGGTVVRIRMDLAEGQPPLV